MMSLALISRVAALKFTVETGVKKSFHFSVDRSLALNVLFSSAAKAKGKMVRTKITFDENILIFYTLPIQQGKLTDDDRKTQLPHLVNKGWSLVENRDAIYKEFLFRDFNQVRIVFFNFNMHIKVFAHFLYLQIIPQKPIPKSY